MKTWQKIQYSKAEQPSEKNTYLKLTIDHTKFDEFESAREM